MGDSFAVGSQAGKGLKAAYLGPAGTYGHQAAKLFVASLGDAAADIELVPCPTISDIYTNPAEYLIMPLQNIIQGGVAETIDSLLSPIAGPSTPRRSAPPRIIADLDLPIRHSLVARRGVRMEDIQWVRSHEQALGQSSAFLAEHLPKAKQVSWASTAGAAMSLLEPIPGDDGAGVGGAICSASAVLEHPELEVIYEGTQAIADNFTRFLLLTRLPPPPLSESPTQPSAPTSHFCALTHPSLLAHLPSGSIRAIHTRPHPLLATSEDRYPHLLLVETDQRSLPGEQEGVVYLGSAVHLPTSG